MKIGSQVYVKGSAKAVQLYKEAFGATLEYHVKNDDGSFFHAELFSDGEFFLAVSEASTGTPAGFTPPTPYEKLLDTVSNASSFRPTAVPPMQFGVEFKDEKAVVNAFEILKTGATITMPLGRLPWSDCCASLVDQFGVNWYLSIPQHRP